MNNTFSFQQIVAPKAVSYTHLVTSRVIKRILESSDLEMSNLLQSELPLQRKIEQGIKIISSLYLKMDKDFLYDLEHSRPELWQQIDDVRKSKEEMIARLLTDAQNSGTIREDMDAKLLSCLLYTSRCV